MHFLRIPFVIIRAHFAELPYSLGNEGAVDNKRNECSQDGNVDRSPCACTRLGFFSKPVEKFIVVNSVKVVLTRVIEIYGSSVKAPRQDFRKNFSQR